MFLELVATVTVGIGTGGLVALINKATRGRLPRWLVPAAAGLSMIGFTIWSEYSWASRTAGGLPEGVVVAWQNAERIVWKPWTYAVPQTTRILAVDLGTARTHPDRPARHLVDLYLMGRWSPNRRVSVVMDCRDGKRADLVGDAGIGSDGAVEGAEWVDVAPDDPVRATVCNTEGKA